MDTETRQALSDLVIVNSDAPLATAVQNWLTVQTIVADLLRQSARDLADEQSWAAVGAVAGTSREAAWQRWH